MRLKQMVSVALCSEMDCCEEHEDPAVEPTEPELRETLTELADRYSGVELHGGPVEEGDNTQRKEQVETQSCATEKKSSSSDPEREFGETECKERRKLKKTNSWKMVRFQDPSTEDTVVERDSSAESLFPQYAMEAWTSSTFGELFVAEDWQNITGEDVFINSTSHAETPNLQIVSAGNAAEISASLVHFDPAIRVFFFTEDNRRSVRPSTCRLAMLSPTLYLSSHRGQAAEKERVGGWGATRPAPHLGPGSYTEDAVCPRRPHCGGEGLQACLCDRRGRCNPGE